MSTAADIIVTMSFHESIFATKCGRPVIAIDTQSNRVCGDTGESKTKCLMQDLGLLNSNYLNLHQTVDFESAFSSCLQAALEVDYEAVKARHLDFCLDYQKALSDLRALL